MGNMTLKEVSVKLYKPMMPRWYVQVQSQKYGKGINTKMAAPGTRTDLDTGDC
jgi:hypothetical protein